MSRGLSFNFNREEGEGLLAFRRGVMLDDMMPWCRFGAAATSAVPDGERSFCLKELSLARALYRIGDFNGLAKRTLEAYLNDPRRAYAEHARLVLGKAVSR